MTPKIKFALFLLPIAFIVISVLDQSGYLNENSGIIVVMFSAAIGTAFDVFQQRKEINKIK
ncbi:hypothetical protein D3H55_16590 [Bacillus salacetis]|uniref:Uncharacterized protein n=1 Tax=Bacillus salacetis TaxID=2315464 RepID=A0A3A1QVT3_9BACI|nr:hypothetical protein [Bacillus salacetis]RIW30741.1 hypothetical protein D3H55_16590 [Bacillus salacetis]